MRQLLTVLFFVTFLLVSATPAFAVTDPLSVQNNKFGIHILFPDEITDAAKLVNSTGGDYGYVTIPIQAGDKDLVKWQKFMNRARNLHLIPIIRLASEGDYFNTKVWRKPDSYDIMDFANFLNSLNWPTKNRYIIVFNEVNRADEWGGEVNAKEYAQILSYATTVFKSKSPDFFIISAGLDNAAPNKSDQYSNEYLFLTRMEEAVPGIFNQIDGIASHSYPNPGFSQPPTKQDGTSVLSYRFEKNLIKTMTDKDLPVFITETGWSSETLPKVTIASYNNLAFTKIWTDNDIVAITPFLLKAGSIPFIYFSFIDKDGNPDLSYKTVQTIPKTKGTPLLNNFVLGEGVNKKSEPAIINFSGDNAQKEEDFLGKNALNAIFWILKI